MARKRYQKGYVYLDGDKWKGRYREETDNEARNETHSAGSYSRQ